MVQLLGRLVKCVRLLDEELVAVDIATVLSPLPISANSLVMLIIGK